MRDQRPAFINEVAGLQIVAMGEAGKGTDVSRIARVCVTQLDVVAGAVFANRQEIGGSNEEIPQRGQYAP